jgi:predicted Rossmann fold nucleotide-binding protein DprA/Smf involved in DNA uptake
VNEDGDQVFISPKIISATGADVGDMLLAHCIDNHKLAPDKDFAARWRAIRISISQKLDPAPYAPSALAQGHSRPKSVLTLLETRDRAWTTAQMARELGVSIPDAQSALFEQHAAGKIARIDATCGGKKQVWYARSLKLVEELIDEVELEDQQ